MASLLRLVALVCTCAVMCTRAQDNSTNGTDEVGDLVQDPETSQQWSACKSNTSDTNPFQTIWAAETHSASLSPSPLTNATILVGPSSCDEKYVETWRKNGRIIYYITAPKTLRPFSQYPVTVTILNSSVPVDVTVQLVRKFENDNDSVSVEAKGTVQQGETNRFSLDLKALGKGSYLLRVKGQEQEGHNFTDESYVSVERSNNLIFVQNDKPLYKLGDNVKFRLIVIDLALKPVQTPLDVKIYDPQRNLIQQHLQVNSANGSAEDAQAGYFEGEIQLASEAPLGQWQIEVTSPQEETTSKSFSVEEYVLPRFDVQIKAPEYLIQLQKSFEITLNSNYTFGEPVKGKATLQVDGPGRYQWELRRDVKLSKNFTFEDFNGTATVRVYVDDIINKTLDDFRSWNTISVSASVTEGSTNTRRQSETKSISLKSDAYKLDIVRTSNTFKPGFPYTVSISAVQHDGRPIPPTTRKLVAKLSQSGSAFGSGYFDSELRSLEVPASGIVEVTVIPAKEARNIFFQARLGKVKASLSIGGFDSPSNSFMQIYPLSKNLSVGNTASFSINLTNAFPKLQYTVINKGQILLENSVAVDGSNAIIELPLNKSYAPRSRLLVYYIREDSEVVANVLDFEVTGLLENTITLSVTPENRTEYAEPGESVTVSIKTAPNSFVGLLAMDQSLLLLKQGNDFNEGDVTQAVCNFDTDTYSFDNAFGSSQFRFPDGRSVYRFLEQAGLVVLSNAAIPGNPKNPDVEPISYNRGGSSGVMYASASFGASAMKDGEDSDAVDMMSSPMALSSGGGARGPSAPKKRKPSKSQSGSPDVRVRKDFRETFLYETLNVGESGAANFSRTVPDTITSWVSSAFSMNSKVGLGLTKGPSKVRVFRPFFAVLNLPFSIIRGETVQLEVLVFNYLDDDQDVQVTLEISGQDSKGHRFVAAPRNKTISVKTGASASVTFPVKPEVVGEIDVKATAISDMAGDSLIRKLKVKPEGIRQQFNAPMFIDLRKESTYQSNLLVPLPQEGRVEGSEKLVFSAIGDLLGPTIHGIDNLIQLPSGCGEQNMALFAPNVFVLKYLTSANRLEQDTKDQLLRNLRSGYQRQQIFKHYDKSYSAFGDSDSSGSTFLTAFVARTFYQAKDFITIDTDLVKGSLDWLVQQQADNGSFPEVGKVFDRELQGGAGKGTALTAYVLITFVEAQSLGNYSETIKNATQFLEGQTKSIQSDPYALSIVNYALQLVGSNGNQFTSSRLEALAVVANGTKHWAKEPEVEIQGWGKYHWEYKLPAKDIEMTAYGLLSAIRKKDIQGGFPILAWLLTKRNQQGGFQTSQDTVVGLQAIAEFAQLVDSKDRDISVHVTMDGNNFKKDFSISDENALVLQSAEPDLFYKEVNVAASGKGTALVQVSWIYYVRNTSGESGFSVIASVSEAKTDIQLRFCASYQKGNSSNMAVMEINLPSGYQVDEEQVKILTSVVPELQRVDVENDNTKLILYFDKLSPEERCVVFNGYRLFVVDNLQNSNVVVYDYYDPRLKQTASYKPKQ